MYVCVYVCMYVQHHKLAINTSFYIIIAIVYDNDMHIIRELLYMCYINMAIPYSLKFSRLKIFAVFAGYR